MKSIRESLVFVEYPEMFIRFQRDEKSVNMPHLHFHDGYEIYIMLSGKADYILSDEHYPLTDGTFMLVKPLEIHKKNACTEKYTTFLLNFNKKSFSEFFTEEALKTILAPFETHRFGSIPPALTDKIVRICKSIVSFRKKNEIVAIYTAELLSLLSKCTCINHSDENSDEAFDKKIYEYVSHNLEKRITLDKLSNALLVSKQSLMTVFKRDFGVSPIFFVNRVKMNFARSMLLYPEFDINTISKYCGYKNQSYFSKVFKSVFGLTPNEFRRRAKIK